jgi:hypothetical protein
MGNPTSALVARVQFCGLILEWYIGEFSRRAREKDTKEIKKKSYRKAVQ